MLAKKAVKLNYFSVERFSKDYAQLQKGRIFLPTKTPLPSKTRLSLNISVPDIDQVLSVEGDVVKTLDTQTAARLKKPAGMLVGLMGGPQAVLKDFNYVLSTNELYRKTLDLTAPVAGDTLSCSGELASSVIYPVNRDKIAKDVRSQLHSFVGRILKAQTTEDAVVLVKLFRRILPALVQQADWQSALYLTRAFDKVAKTTDLFSKASGLPANPLTYVFEDRTAEIVTAYAKADDSQRIMIADIAGCLGVRGIEILSIALADCPDRGGRKIAMDALIKKSDLARDWVLKVLDDPEQNGYLKRNALLLLRIVGKREEQIDRARELVRHEHPGVRGEAINVIVMLKAGGAEDLVLAALEDADDRVRRRAITGLSELAPVSEASIAKLLALITAKSPKDKEAAVRHYRQVARLIRVLGAISHLPERDSVEDTILKIGRKMWHKMKGLSKRLKKTSDPNQFAVLAAAITTLGNIGTAKSESFLEKLAASKSAESEPAQKAANHIRLRQIEQLSNAAADTEMPAGGKGRQAETQKACDKNFH